VPAGFVAEYAVEWQPRAGELLVDARYAAGVASTLRIDDGAETFVRSAEASRDGVTWSPLTRTGQLFGAAPCAAAACRVRYRYALREAGASLDDVDLASLEGNAIEAPPSTWLLAPTDASGRAPVRFRVSCPEGTRFATGVFPSAQASGAWDISLDDLATAPYSVFGALRVRTAKAVGAAIEVAIAEGKLAVPDDRLVQWTEDAARAITSYFGRFPMPTALVILVPGRGRWVGGGRTLAGGGGTVFMRVGERAREEDFRDDWVLVHEMTHLVFPSVPRAQNWAEEGFATYVEPFARVRAGLLKEEDAWLGLLEGLPNGLPRPGDQGLDRTPTWGRTYWGGALFYLLADVEMRTRTQGRVGLPDAMRGVLDAGGNDASRWPLDDVFAVADRATGLDVLEKLHLAMGTSPHPVDLDALFASLGVSSTRAGVKLDPKAPLARVRRAIATGIVGD
jgi:predicted metalloprotease with PDZ domain